MMFVNVTSPTPLLLNQCCLQLFQFLKKENISKQKVTTLSEGGGEGRKRKIYHTCYVKAVKIRENFNLSQQLLYGVRICSLYLFLSVYVEKLTFLYYFLFRSNQ